MKYLIFNDFTGYKNRWNKSTLCALFIGMGGLINAEGFLQKKVSFPCRE